MTSILTNTAAMSALSNLTVTQRQLSKTQAQVSSGLAVGTASDNAAYWSIGKTMSAQVAGLAAVQQSLSLTNSIAAVTAAALTSIKNSLQKIEADVVTASEAGTDATQVQSDITAQQQSIISVANAASFNGVSWLINHTLSSTSTYIVLNVDVSKTEFDSIALGQDPGAVAHFESTITQTSTATQSGVKYSQTNVSGSTAVMSDAQDGTFSNAPTQKRSTQTGDDRLSSLESVQVPASMASDGSLAKFSLSIAPLTLFSDNVSTSSFQEDVYYDHVLDTSSSYPLSSGSYGSASYEQPGGGATAGILDSPFAITQQVYVPAYTPNAPGSSVTVPVLGKSGGSTATYNTAASTPGGYYPQTTYKSVLDFSVVGLSRSQLATVGEALEMAMSGIVTASTIVGGLQNQISNQQTFNSALSDSLTSGIGSLVDADMNVASVRLQALQAQQLLGIQALSIANQNSQLVLKLFQAA